MTIQQKLIPQTNTDAQRQLFTQIKELNNYFWQRVTAVQLDSSSLHTGLYYDIIRDFDTAYKQLNQKFREIFFAENANKTNINLYNRTFNKHKMIDMLKIKHPEYIITELNGFTKFQFNVQILCNLFKEQLCMMFAQYGAKLNYLQFLISYTKCINEYFIATDVDWAAAQQMLVDFYTNVDFSEISTGAAFYGVKIRTRKSGLKYQSKTSALDIQVREMLNQGMKRKDITKSLNISEKTLYNMIKNNPYLQ